MPDKQSFYNSINQDTDFSEEFYKKVYGYSVYDNQFLKDIAMKLASIGKKEVIVAYNLWLDAWNRNHEEGLKNVAEWYVKECNKHYSIKKDSCRKEGGSCSQVKTELLLKKKQLLLMRKLQQLTGNCSN